MKEALCKAFCEDIEVRSVPMGMAVSTGFAWPDGDRIGFYVKADQISGLYELQDSGMVLPSLEANGLDLKNKGRREAFLALLGEYGVLVDEDEREFRLQKVTEAELPHAALRFVSFLLRVYDLLLLNEERVASTFRADVERRLREIIGDRARIVENTPLSPELSEFIPDFVVSAPGRAPVGVYLGTSDARVLEALFVQMRAAYEIKERVSVMALLETERAVSKKVRQQAMNRLAAVTHYRGDEAAALGRIAREALGSAYAVN